MKIPKNRNMNIVIIICITLISLLEIYFAYKVTKGYSRVYNTGIFILFLLQPFYYIAVFKKDKTHLKLKIALFVLISFILPLIIYFTLPNYTYNEGKQIVEQYVHSRSNLIFIDISNDKNTVPVINNPKQ